MPGLYYGPGSCFALRDIPAPVPPARDFALLAPRLAGMCGSDLGAIFFESAPSLSAFASMPSVFGHEILADVLGGCAASGIREGDRVVVDPWPSCEVRGAQDCARCALGEYAACERAGIGPRKGIMIGTSRELPGGFGERMVAHASQLFRVPDGVPDARAVLTEPLSVAVHAILRHPPQGAGRVLVIGGGMIAFATVWALREMYPDAHVTLLAAEDYQLALGRTLGAQRALRPERGEDVVVTLSPETGGAVLRPVLGRPFLASGFDRVYECIGSQKSLDDALRVTRAAGTVVLLGPRLAAVRRGALALRERLAAGPAVVAVRTLPLATLAYPTKYAFWAAAFSPLPYISMVHRCLLVQFLQRGAIKTLLFNPTDVERSKRTPFFAKIIERIGPAARLLSNTFDPLEVQLAALGLVPEDIDYVAFDNFHTQDVRGLLGTTDGRLRARFPRAQLLAPLAEWLDWDDLYPIQRAWFVADGKEGMVEDRVVFTRDDLQLGDGVMLVRTPGHTSGNQTLFFKTERGVWGCSENGVCVDNWSPRASRIPGLATVAKHQELDFVLNANTPEYGADQYTSMTLEKPLVDPVPENPAFCQMFSSSEAAPHRAAGMARPSRARAEHGAAGSPAARRAGHDGAGTPPRGAGARGRAGVPGPACLRAGARWRLDRVRDAPGAAGVRAGGLGGGAARAHDGLARERRPRTALVAAVRRALTRAHGEGRGSGAYAPQRGRAHWMISAEGGATRVAPSIGISALLARPLDPEVVLRTIERFAR